MTIGPVEFIDRGQVETIGAKFMSKLVMVSQAIGVEKPARCRKSCKPSRSFRIAKLFEHAGGFLLSYCSVVVKIPPHQAASDSQARILQGIPFSSSSTPFRLLE